MRILLGGALAAVLTMTVLTACGDDDVPTASDLAEELVTESDLEGEWTVTTGPPGETGLPSGIVSEGQRDLLPSLDLCPEAPAASQEAAEGLEWEDFRQLEMTVDDPVDPPSDMEGHSVIAQQFLTAGDADALSATFDALREGLLACLGDIPAGEEGAGSAEEIVLPLLGDQQIAVFTEFEEAGGEGMWNIYEILVRKDDVLMAMMVGDVWLGDLEPMIGVEEFQEIVTMAADKI